MTPAIVETAVDLARHFRVQPARDKIPVAKGWPAVASNEPETIRNLFFDAPGADQISILTGHGLLVLDVDTRKGGDASIAALAQVHGKLPATVCTITGGGGWHLFFRLPPGVEARNSSDKLGSGLDIRGDGGQVIGPGSAHPSGNPYVWAEGSSPDEVAIAPCPDWLLALVRKEERKVSPPPIAPVGTNRREALYRASKYLARCEPAVSGQGGHQKAWDAALAVYVGFDLSEDDAYELLATEYNPRCTPPWSEKELRHKLQGAAGSTLVRGYLLNAPRPGATVHQLPRPQGTSTPVEAPPVEAPGVVLGEQFADVWKTVGEHGLEDGAWLSESPPPMEWLLTQPADPQTGRDEQGYLERGCVGMFVAGGGVGKTKALVQLALACAVGRVWLADSNGEQGFLPPSGGGNVLVILGESNKKNARRRFFGSWQMLKRTARLNDDELDLANRRIVVLPVAGKHVSLVAQDPRSHEENRPSEAALEIVSRLNAAPEPWSLIIIDPLSRFAGANTEKDNKSATNFIEVLELFTQVKGNPNVIIAHHTSAQTQRDDRSDSTSGRGSSALVAGARWQAVLSAEPRKKGAPRTALLKVTKVNEGPGSEEEPYRLVRGEFGDLRGATREENEAREADQPNKKPSKGDQRRNEAQADHESVAELLKQIGNPMSRNEIAERLHLNKDRVTGILQVFMRDNKVSMPNGRNGGFKWVS